MDAVMFSSASGEWPTPDEFFQKLNDEFHFTLDVAATAGNAKCPRYYDVITDGLAQDWTGENVWMNPPYGRGIDKWIAKAHEAKGTGTLTVALIPARTDTLWWHRYIEPIRKDRPEDVRFLKGRLKFGGAQHPAPFPSVVVVFRP